MRATMLNILNLFLLVSLIPSSSSSFSMSISSLLSCPHGEGLQCEQVDLPNNNFKQIFKHHYPNFDPYSSQNLKLLPDVNETGPEFYTTTYHLHNLPPAPPGKKSLLTFPAVYGNCTVTFPNGTTLNHFSPFLPLLLPSPPSSLTLTLSPPLNSGLPSHLCPPTTPTPCGQGGDHTLSTQSYIQFTQGWDWIQSSPDRGTTISKGTYEIYNSKINEDWKVTYKNNVATISVDCSECDSISVTLISGSNKVYNSISVSKTVHEISIDDPELWWPWTIGSPYLYEIIFTGHDRGGDEVCSLRDFVGLKTSELVYDDKVGGNLIKVNGVEVFIQGGNWIALDQFFTKTDREEYYNVIKGHKSLGFNFIRVWGGGITENKEFYEVCDELGMMVYQEFWMTGDNNGRWAGSYSEPVNVETYNSMIYHTVKSLRKHASLTLYGGGNELYPKELSPPDSIKKTLYEALEEYDPDRPFIMSSMDGGLQGMNMSEHSDGYALAVKDGPYGFLDVDRYFEEANPGLVNGSDVTIAFQPEIGAASFPRFESYKIMDVGSSFPSEGDEDVPDDWQWHNFEGYSYTAIDGTTVDPIYALGKPESVEEYAVRADLASRQQYASLFRGFSAKMFEPSEEGGKTAVLLWKSQTPWPSFRGFTYDYYGAATGCADGVREGLGGEFDINAFDDWTNRSVKIVNRGVSEREGRAVTVSYYSRFGESVAPAQVFEAKKLPVGVTTLGGLEFPPGGNVTFIRTEIAGGHTSWSWRREIDGVAVHDLAELGDWRKSDHEWPGVEGKVHEVVSDDEAWRTFKVSLKVKAAIAFAPGLTARDSNGDRILPLLTDAPVLFLPANDGDGDGKGEFVVKTRSNAARPKRIEIRFWAGEAVMLEI
ncbi:hypothetical protein TrST_g379 [Triparma strigata]|uniref:Glycoside hydrolase family 2 immunoglobulin-like beta-sandwich domain-containing protein n=1 Tax=Triparma strigata TaxID=1606541 RepID=A0A9W6ZWM5_9STRA|nr:hypothetical protein TrST_g379 [Triparma strigata]